MSKSIVIELEDREAIADPVTDLLRTGAQQLIQRAVEAELSELLSQHGDRRTETGKAGVVRRSLQKVCKSHQAAAFDLDTTLMPSANC